MILCDTVYPQLNSLADGEVGILAAFRIRRHLDACAECRAEYDEIRLLTAQARAWRSVDAPQRLQARIADALPQHAETQENTPMTVSQRVSQPRRLRWQPLAGAGALAALLIAGALFFPGSPGRPTVAFADVQRAMRKLEAVSWTQTQSRYDMQGHLTLHNTQQFWVRRDHPAVAEQDRASSVPQVAGGEYAGPAWRVSDAHGWINYHPQEGVYYVHPSPKNIAREVQETIDSLTASAAPGTPWKMEREILSGRTLLVFRSHIHTETDAGEPGRRTIDGDDTLWADPDTLRVVRHQSDIVWGPFRAVSDGGKTRDFPGERIVLDAAGFQYDQPAPAGVFALTPSASARVTEDDGKGNKTLVVYRRQ